MPEPDGGGPEAVVGLRHRQMSVDVHEYVRGLIVNGELAPHSVFSQAEIARTLGVSRGPVREAFRRLQEEGLIHAEPNMRPRVAGFDPVSLDSLYGARVAIEALGAQVTCAKRSDRLIAELKALLRQMDTVSDDQPVWREAHRAFHGAIVSGAGTVIHEMTVSLAARSEPYYNLYGTNPTMSDADHHAVVDAFEKRQPDIAMKRHARHVARTALSVLATMAPEYDPVNVRSALAVLGVSTPAE